jgi:hypothetical protein
MVKPAIRKRNMLNVVFNWKTTVTGSVTETLSIKSKAKVPDH